MSKLRLAALLPPVALLLIFAHAPARAAFIHGLVAEVPDATRLVVSNSNRRLTVVLKGVAAPRDAGEAEQARGHLARLALNREVRVEYTGLRGGRIYGRALCGAMDLGLQLVRDGAARYDAADDNALTAEERQLYAASERAARDERRGVWQGSGGGGAFAAAGDESVAPAGRQRPRASMSTEELTINRIAAAAAKRPKPGAARLPKATGWPLNSPGEVYDFSPHLGQGRTTIVYFYADWCPACRQTTPLVRDINGSFADVEVLALDIAEWGSPVVNANGVGFVPYFQIYDKSGALLAEGKQARQWLAQEFRHRGGRR